MHDAKTNAALEKALAALSDARCELSRLTCHANQSSEVYARGMALWTTIYDGAQGLETARALDAAERRAGAEVAP
jgi:hypothetical protein